jgi:demethylmenaquinone methyltransferase/2-methoxy-6-polyprenyl-1,4-benzoquinol methylase
MLEVGRRKIKEIGSQDKITLIEGDSENLPFGDGEFDAAMVAFGVRNFEDPLKGLKEIRRVTRSGGKVCILEFTMPGSFPVRPVYKFYFKRVLPFIGRLISRDFSAYTYLPESVEAFAQREEFLALMEKAGFEKVGYKIQSFGIAAIYFGYR